MNLSLSVGYVGVERYYSLLNMFINTTNRGVQWRTIQLTPPTPIIEGACSPVHRNAYDQNSNRKQRWCKPVSPSIESSSNR